MPNAVSSFIQSVKTRTLSIGQMTFGSFLLLLTIIAATSIGSVVAIRHIDRTFGELQRLQSVGDLAEEIERRMSDLRFAARQAVTEPGAQPASKVFTAASALTELLKKTRLELAPDQR
ncbi:histidine kinase, partial [Rhodopseudomonas sp. BR0C11]|nr:histidine kinase [Rhodopseudomonas sp. BR0C11]